MSRRDQGGARAAGDAGMAPKRVQLMHRLAGATAHQTLYERTHPAAGFPRLTDHSGCTALSHLFRG
jgi:hypothetical protein